MDESVQRVVVDGRFDALFRDSSISIKQLRDRANAASRMANSPNERTRRRGDHRPMPLDFVNAKEKNKKHIRLP